MKKRILSLVLCAAMLLSMCLFLGAGVTDDTYKVTVNYIYESNSSPVAQATVLQVAKGETLTKEIAIPTQLNYTPKLADDTPNGITLDPATGMLKFENFMPTENVTVKVFYVAGNAKYTVNHYLQNLEDDKYTLKDTVEMTGSIDAYTEAVAKKYDGFTAGEVARSPIAADGTTVVDIKYTRNYYMVQFDANGGVNGPEPVYAKYGTTYKMPQGPEKAGYDFAGWFDRDDKQVTQGIVKANVTYTAQWTPKSNEAGVTVVYWGQNANDDEYSYYGAAVLTDQKVDGKLTWNDVRSQTAYTCGLEEHTHTSDCKLNCAHAGSHAFALSCVGLDGATSVNPNSYGDNDAKKHFENQCTGTKACKKTDLKRYLKNGSVCKYKDGTDSGTDYYYFLYFEGEYYKISSELYNNLKSDTGAQVKHSRDTYYVYEWNGKCLHTHTAACYSCGKIVHTHSDDCKKPLNAKMDSSLWTYEKSDTVTVDAAGNTVMNVYYKRTKFTLTFVLDKAEAEGNYTKTLTEPWGKRIKSDFDQIEAEEKGNLEQFNKNFGTNYHLYAWKDSTTSYNTNNVMIMPSVNKTLTAQAVSGSTELSMYYYAADLQGNYPQEPSFTIKFVNDGSVTVTEDEYYEWEGFEINKEKSTKTGENASGARFYYDRKAYDLKFFSGNNAVPVRSERPKFEQPLNEFADFQPDTPPQGVESDAEFAGWYLNPQCTGEQYDLSTHKMPANNIALYAKWVNRSYTVTTYTDESLKTLYTHDDYDGSQSVVKYEKGVAPTNPTKDGYVFVGWFYKDNGIEKPFSFEMGITKDYNLYPKWSNQVNVTYTIQYIDRKTDQEIADSYTASARMGSTVTVKSKAVAGYFPELTSTSVQITEENQVIKLYYQSGTKLTYTVKYVETVNGVDQDIAPSETQATTSIQVVEFAKNVEGYTPDYYQKTLELTAGGENVLTFYYTKQVTIKYVPLEGGSVTPETETLIRTTGEAHGSTATPDASYKFIGWFKDEACTLPVDESWVDDNNKLTPQQENNVYEGATYYAKFELDVFDLTITKAGENIDPNQIFVFRVVSDDNKTDMEVTVKGIGSVTIKGLPLGTTYTVTEETDWTWQYTPDKSKEVFTPSGDYSVTFTNTYSKSNWLTSFAEVINKWIDGKIDPIKVKN